MTDSFVCCRVRVDGVGPGAAVREILDSRHGRPRSVHLCNAYTLALALRDPAYRAELNQADLNFADGHYVAVVGRWRGQQEMTERVYGPDLMLAAVDQGRERGLRHYLYGATDATVARLAQALRDRCPGVEIVGVEAPPFRPLTATEEAALAARVAQARPDVLWVGLGTPRQDHFVFRYTEALNCTVVPVGAAFDFISGTKRTAPRSVQRAGLEWLFRLVQEPRRLWRRYLVGIPVYLFGVLTDLGRPVPVRPAARAVAHPVTSDTRAAVAVPAQVAPPGAAAAEEPAAPQPRRPADPGAVPLSDAT